MFIICEDEKLNVESEQNNTILQMYVHVHVLNCEKTQPKSMTFNEL